MEYKSVCPFLSSTFVDFQDEREYLVKKIFPTLNNLCQGKGTFFSPVDLRWGITEEQAQKGQVIRTCLDFIEKSAPFFICLLGGRYGQHRGLGSPCLPEKLEDLPADSSWLDRSFVTAASNGHPWVLNEENVFSSVTELEVKKAAFHDQLQHCYFYIRETSDESGESSCARKRLDNLKEKILQSGYVVHRFHTAEDLGELVLQDWTAVINELFPETTDLDLCGNSKSREERQEEISQKVFADSKRRVFVKTPVIEELIERLFTFADEVNVTSNSENEKNILVVCGKQGSGKSALVTAALDQIHEMSVLPAFVLYVGGSSKSSDITYFMRNVTIKMRHFFSGRAIQEPGDCGNFQEVLQCFLGSLELGTSVVVIDGLDKLGRSLDYSPKQVQELSWLPECIPKCCRMILTCNENTSICETLSARTDTVILSIPTCQDQNFSTELVKQHLSTHHKALSEKQLAAVTKTEYLQVPLFLTTVINELRLFGSYEQLDEYIEKYCSVENLQELWSMIVARWCKEYGNVQDDYTGTWGGWVQDVLCLIHCSWNGLTKTELLDILPYIGYGYTSGLSAVTPFDLALLGSAAGDVIMDRNDGALVIADDHLANAVAVYLKDSQDERHQRSFYHKQISAYLWQRPHSARRSLELPWQLRQHEEPTYLRYVLCEPLTFLELYDLKYDHSRRLDLIGYWEYLKSENVNPGALYWQLLSFYSPIDVEEFQKECAVSPDIFKKLSTSAVCYDMPHWMPKFEDLPEFCKFASAVGQFLAETGRFEGSEVILELAHWTLDKKYLCMRINDQKLLCEIRQALAELHYYQLNKRKSEFWYKKNLETVNQVIKKQVRRGKRTEIDLLATYEIKGKVLDRLGNMKTFDFKYDEAEELLNEAQETMGKARSEMGKTRVTHHLATLKMRNGNGAEAEQLFYHCIGVLERWLGKTHPKVSDIWNDLANLKGDSRSSVYDREEALKIYTKTLKIREDSLGKNHLLVATTLYHMGKLLVNGKDTAEQKIRTFKLWQALNIRAENLGVCHPLTVAVKNYIDKIIHKNEETRGKNHPKKPHPSETDSCWRQSCGVLNRVTPGAGRVQIKGPWYNSFNTLNQRNKRRDDHWTSEAGTLSRKSNRYFHYIDDFYMKEMEIDEVRTLVNCDAVPRVPDKDHSGPGGNFDIDMDKLQSQFTKNLHIEEENVHAYGTENKSQNACFGLEIEVQLDARADGQSVIEFTTDNVWEKSERVLRQL